MKKMWVMTSPEAQALQQAIDNGAPPEIARQRRSPHGLHRPRDNSCEENCCNGANIGGITNP